MKTQIEAATERAEEQAAEAEAVPPMKFNRPEDAGYGEAWHESMSTGKMVAQILAEREAKARPEAMRPAALNKALANEQRIEKLREQAQRETEHAASLSAQFDNMVHDVRIKRLTLQNAENYFREYLESYAFVEAPMVESIAPLFAPLWGNPRTGFTFRDEVPAMIETRLVKCACAEIAQRLKAPILKTLADALATAEKAAHEFAAAQKMEIPPGLFD